MAHVTTSYAKLSMPDSTHNKIDSQKMFIDNIIQEEANYVELSKRISHVSQSVIDLMAIDVTSDMIADGTVIAVSGVGVFYYDASSDLDEIDNIVVEPNVGSGRWISVGYASANGMLGNVPNVATNDQTPTYTMADSDTDLASGEKLSIAFGKISKAIHSFIAHDTNSTRHITSAERSTWNAKASTSVATTSANGLMSSTDKTKLNNIASNANKTVVDTSLSVSSTNPVQNKVITSANGVSTLMNQLTSATSTPQDADYYISQYAGGGTTTKTYNRRPMSALWTYIKSKLADVATSGSYSDLSNVPTSLPASDVKAWAKADTKPSYTKSEVGLGSVPNVATNDQTPTYSDTTTFATLVSGEKISVALAKVKLAITKLISHIADTTSHITSAERSTWNAKASTSVATTSANGLMSSTDKTKLNNIASNANNYTHPNSGVTAGTYKSLTVNAQGHITGGTNPTTLSEYGITDGAIIKTLTSENLNNVTTPGLYNAGGSNTVLNSPLTTGSAFGLEVIHTADGNYYTQIVYKHNESKSYRRICNNGTWGSWILDELTDTTYTLDSFGVNATASEINYLTGASSNIQVQINNISGIIGDANALLESI